MAHTKALNLPNLDRNQSKSLKHGPFVNSWIACFSIRHSATASAIPHCSRYVVEHTLREMSNNLKSGH